MLTPTCHFSFVLQYISRPPPLDYYCTQRSSGPPQRAPSCAPSPGSLSYRGSSRRGYRARRAAGRGSWKGSCRGREGKGIVKVVAGVDSTQKRAAAVVRGPAACLHVAISSAASGRLNPMLLVSVTYRVPTYHVPSRIYLACSLPITHHTATWGLLLATSQVK